MDINEPQTNGQVEVLGCEGSGGGSQPSLDRFDRIDFSGIFKIAKVRTVEVVQESHDQV